jgi:outer membrane protein TolC
VAYQAGRLDLSALLAAEQAVSDARATASRAIADRFRALAALEHAVGGSLLAPSVSSLRAAEHG